MKLIAALAAALAMALSACQAPVPTAQARPRIEKAADLPRFAYPVQGKLDEMVRSPTAFAPFAHKLRADTESVLAGYDIADMATRRDLMTLVAVLDYLDGRYDRALERAEAVRALEEKPADKLMSGLRLRAAATAAKSHTPGTQAFAAAVEQYLNEALSSMPYGVVANEVREAKMYAEIAGEGLALGRVREVLQPVADASGSLSSDLAPMLAYTRFSLTAVLPLKATWIKAYGGWLGAHKVEKPDIWAARDVTLPASGPHAPVRVAVWDSGVDTALFKDQVLRDAAGKPLLIAFDKFSRPAQGELAPIPAELRDRLPKLVARSKGFSDLQSNIDTPEASEVKQWLSTLPPDRFKPDIEELSLGGNYEHGTHVAGITLGGNPFARLAVARIEFGHTLQPDPCPSVEQAGRDAAAARAYVDFFERNGVRVVNMSWGGSIGDVESDLEKCGIGKSPAERKAQARKLFDIGKQALTEAMGAAENILFVAAAGNENQDSSFAESMPADIVLPNLLTVGAVDRAGDEASFTSYGPTVKVHANGYQVESYLPGGARVALSGTSMAAPQVSNLAAKLLAVKPELTPQQLIRVIIDTAESSSDGRRRLIHPKKAMAAVQGG